ncbi:MAG: signal peptidase I [Oscillospiraceae bacterium]|nr:signal peptidase I [Oscillospiraceae bacterium]MBQ9981440.1 signal peptidase I [Oscillospiraceae bacterium]
MKKTKLIFELINPLIIFFLLFLFLLNFKIVIVDGKSMEPIYENGELLIMSRRFDSISLDDVILFEYDNINYIKRVVAVEGDNIKINNGQLFINEKLINNYSIPNNISKEFTLNKNEFYVLGDNYQNSIDSRDFGVINYSWISAKMD